MLRPDQLEKIINGEIEYDPVGDFKAFIIFIYDVFTS